MKRKTKTKTKTVKPKARLRRKRVLTKEERRRAEADRTKERLKWLGFLIRTFRVQDRDFRKMREREDFRTWLERRLRDHLQEAPEGVLPFLPSRGIRDVRAYFSNTSDDELEAIVRYFPSRLNIALQRLEDVLSRAPDVTPLGLLELDEVQDILDDFGP